uniref:PID domain-containing protein n=1 Tax=Steinernema glaseri TaxID=37863 RepID=A0A1I7YT18_9BILA
MSWLWGRPPAKAHFYVWYLGSREADGVRGAAVVLPAMRQTLRDSFRRAPNKATVQVSAKGLKLLQTVPTVSRRGKVKMQLAKFVVAANCVTFCMAGRAPFDDVVGVVMLVRSAESHAPLHVHVYRCDGPDTAALLVSNLQVLISRPETQRSIRDLEQRLFQSGILRPRSPPPPSGRLRSETSRMPRRDFQELRHRVAGSSGDLRGRGSVDDLGSFDEFDEAPLFRRFGDLTLPSVKSRSLDNLNGSHTVSRNLRGTSYGDRFPRLEVSDPFGRSYEHSVGSRFWKEEKPRRHSRTMFQDL